MKDISEVQITGPLCDHPILQVPGTKRGSNQLVIS